MNKNFQHAESRAGLPIYKRSWRELFLRESRVSTKKEKEPKRKKLRKGTLVETAAAEEIE
jgi:hypothetical protein